MHKKTFSPMLLLSAALAFAALSPRAEGEPDEATKARNLQNLLDKNKGDAVALAAVLLAENNEARETIRNQKAELAKVQVPEGAVVLTKEQAAQWTEYQALGAPAEVKTKIETGAAAAEKLTGFEKKETLRTVAERVGYKPSVLEKLGGDLTFEELEVDGEKAGEKVKTFGVKGADGKVQPLAEYAKANWGDFLPALTTVQGGSTGGAGGGTGIVQPRIPLGGTGAPAGTGRTPDQIAADKRQSGEFSM
ncbi:hypothetical protein [Deinococcus ruber]|uniref:Uncharacterized protein n=1 Tax=Deinococcus ruber TaxID=1848197 RepID=A0A918C124_9DEIO|nr:hypothetical protein [Deinococcus ruber]GGR00245.1 hypothetical protein GCM10008957_11240 [Deinococcus ruber]